MSGEESKTEKNMNKEKDEEFVDFGSICKSKVSKKSKKKEIMISFSDDTSTSSSSSEEETIYTKRRHNKKSVKSSYARMLTLMLVLITMV